MQRFKKVVAIALTATMVLGCTVTAFAGDNDGSSTGAGASEGHVDKKATSVTLPTMPESGSPFAYTMDPERLIAETSHGKYGDSVIFPATGDTGVYWNNGAKGGDGADKDYIVYANSSAPQKVINKSSHAISLTVNVAASTAATDIPLVAQAAVASATDPSLYLGLKVNAEDAVAVSTSTAATKTVSIAGTPANFKTAVKSDKSGYEYRQLTLTEYQALDGNSSKTQADFDATWAAATFQLEGAVTSGKAITSTTTAPTVSVTWSWVDPSAAPATVDVTIKNKGDYTGEDTTKTMTVGSAPVDPTAVAGYTFAGYFTDAACATAFEGNVAADTSVLYAKWTADSEAPSIAVTEYTMEADTPIEITVDLGVGSAAATSVSSVMDPTGVFDYLANGYAEYNSSTKKVTLKASMVNACISANVGSVDIVFDEDTSITITLNKE